MGISARLDADDEQCDDAQEEPVAAKLRQAKAYAASAR